jgi:hypothetical protein
LFYFLYFEEKMHKELIREHTLTAKYNFFKTEPYPIKEWVRIDCPARIDLAGGWSDTPPVCYTLNGGGIITNNMIDITQYECLLILGGKFPVVMLICGQK